MKIYEYSWKRHMVGEIGPGIRAPRDVFEAIKSMFMGLESERLVVLFLNTKNAIMGVETVYVGSLNSAVVRVGELFRGAIRLNSACIMIVHNHPSGDPEPSPQDLHLTAECVAAGRLLDIPLLDSMVVTETGYVSLRDRGMISN